MQPVVLFVDGPTGVGKDYFINNLAKYARNKGISPLILTAKDFIPGDVAQKHRKEINSDKDTLDLIFLGHKALLIRVFTDLMQRDTNFIIVNRSFSSFVLHNLHSVDLDTKKEYVEEYSSFFLDTITNEGIKSHYIGLIPRYEEDQVETLYTEILKRDRVSMDKEFVKRQLDFHLLENNLYTGIYDHATELTSSDFKLAFYEAFGR